MPWVFNRAGRCVVEYRDAWTPGVAAAGLDGLLVHDLRRPAARNLRRMGLSAGETMKVLGHKTRAIFDRYQIVTDEDVSRQAGELDRKAAEEAANTTDGGHLGATRRNGVN